MIGHWKGYADEYSLALDDGELEGRVYWNADVPTWHGYYASVSWHVHQHRFYYRGCGDYDTKEEAFEAVAEALSELLMSEPHLG